MEACLKYYDLLELPTDATIADIQKNYRYLKNLYSGDSIEITALNDDFSQEIRLDYLSRLDDAYENLSVLLEGNKPASLARSVSIDDELRCWIRDIGCLSGAVLRTIRERMGVEIKDIFTATRIQPQYLDDIENEAFDSFRAEVYLRSYLVEYTRFLSLDTQKVLGDYMPRYRSWAASRPS
jgi:hypothetical protein